MQGQALHEERRDEAEDGDTDHHLPHHPKAVCKRHTYSRPQRLVEGFDNGDDGVRDCNPFGEPLDELCWEAADQLGLQDGDADGE